MSPVGAPLRAGIGALVAVLALMAGAARPAGASASAKRATAARPVGVVPDVPTGTHLHHRPRAHLASLDYQGGSVLHANRTHLIFWAPAGSGLSFEPGYATLIETFLAQVAADSHRPSNVYSVSGQYTDSSGPAAYASTYAGALLDTDPLPASPDRRCVEPPLTGPGWGLCVNDSGISAEIAHFVGANSLPTANGDIYFLITPNGLGSCTGSGPENCALGGKDVAGSYCGYHYQTPDARILYSVIPYNDVPGHCQSDNPKPNASPADPTISTLSHEHNETVTDPFGSGWHDTNGNENGDLCATDFGRDLGGVGQLAWNQVIGGGHYYLQEEWSNEDGSSERTACQASDERDSLAVHAPGTVRGDRRVLLSASGRDPDGQIRAYDWSFGDGGTGRHHRLSHVFTRAGLFPVVVRGTDSAGNWSFSTVAIRVLVPPRPTTTITASPAPRTRSTRPRFRFSSTAVIAAFQCRVDRGAWRACRSPYRTGRLPRGRHRFHVRSSDTFGQLERGAAGYAFKVL